MRLAIISDTHLPRGSRRIPPACLEAIRTADLVLHAGDVTADAVLRELEAIGPPLHAVAGNRDDDALQARLPVETVVEVAGARIAMIHDAGPSRGRLARLRRRFPDADAVVFGHSHIPFHEADGGFQIFNPGSPTDKRREAEFTMGVAEVEGGAVRFAVVGLGPHPEKLPPRGKFSG